MLSPLFFTILLSVLLGKTLATVIAPEDYPKNCYEVMQQRMSADDGVYVTRRSTVFDVHTVLCNMYTMGGGWTYIMRRFNGSQDFHLNYTDYVRGFGSAQQEFWIGLHFLTALAYDANTELLVELTDVNDRHVFAHYDTFTIGGEDEGFPISNISGYSGNAGDSLTAHLGAKFSAPDMDQDNSKSENCANKLNAAWWYDSCDYAAQLTGPYHTKSGLYWLSFSGDNLKEVSMMVRAKDA